MAKLAASSFNPDYPLASSFPRRREPSETNTPRVRGCCQFIGFTTTAYLLRVRGQNVDFVPLMKQLAIRLSWQKTPAKSLVIRGDYCELGEMPPIPANPNSTNWIPAFAGMTLLWTSWIHASTLPDSRLL